MPVVGTPSTDREDVMLEIGPFRIEECVGSGGMGVVHRAAWGGHGPQIPVAVKFITTTDPAERDPAFLREARMAARLSHRNVVTLLDVGHVDKPVTLGDSPLSAGVPYLVMEWVDGPTVKGARPDDFDKVSHLLDGLLAALGHAHAWGVVHRDIKPGNVMLTSDGEVKLTDFGIGRVLESDEDSNEDRRVLGTPHYMAPEQIIGSWRDEGPWTDLYGVGILAWRLATGEVPFTGPRKVVLAQQIREDPHEFKPLFDVPAGFEDWIRRALQKNTRERFRRAADARRALRALANAPRRSTRRYLEALDDSSVSLAAVKPEVPERWPNDDQAVARDLRPAGLGLFGMRRAPIVGRDEEKTRLWETLRATTDDGRARTVIIRGHAGTGKSALAEWLARRALEGGYADVLRSFWESEPVPGDAIEGTLERFFGIEDLPRPEAVKRVRQKLVSIGLRDEATQLAAALAERVVRDQRTSRGLTSRDEWLHMVTEIVGALARERPLIWVLDDVQWSSTAVDLVRRVTASDLPILFVATLLESVDAARPPGFEGYLESVVECDSSDVLDLAPLTAEAQRELVGNLLRLEPALVQEVVHRTDGSPLFAAQLIGDWVVRDALEPGPFGYKASEASVSELPADIHEMWQHRLQSALANSSDPGVQKSLALAAVLGKEVDRREWESALEVVGAYPDPDIIETLVVHGLATWHFGGFAFVHRMLRESILVGADDVPGLNRTVAESLIRSDRRDARTLERTARHLHRAKAYPEAFEFLVQAIEEYYQAEDIDSVIVLGGILDDWSELADATRSLSLATAIARLGAVHRYRGQLDVAKMMLSRAVDIALDGDTPEELINNPEPRRNRLVARLTSELAIVGEETIPDYEVTLRMATVARDVAGAADIAIEEAWGAAMQASTLSETGKPQEALEAARFAVERLEQAGLTQGRHGMHSYFTLSEVSKLAGRLEESQAALNAGMTVARQIGQRIGVAYGLSRRADHFFTVGQLGRAREAANQSHELYRQTGAPTADYIAANILLYDLEEERFDGALERARRLLERWKGYGMDRRLPTFHLSVAVCEAHRGTDDRAREHYDHAISALDSSGRIVDDAVVLSVLLADHSSRPELRQQARRFAHSHRNLLPARYVERLDRLRAQA